MRALCKSQNVAPRPICNSWSQESNDQTVRLTSWRRWDAFDLYLIVLRRGNHEEDRRDPVETLEPGLPLGPLPSHVHHLERDLLYDEVVLHDSFRRLPRKQNVLLARDEVLENRRQNVYKLQSYKRSRERLRNSKCTSAVTHELTNAIQVIQEVFDRLALRTRRKGNSFQTFQLDLCKTSWTWTSARFVPRGKHYFGWVWLITGRVQIDQRRVTGREPDQN